MTYYRSQRAFGFDPILILIVTNTALFLVTTLAPDLIYTLGLQPAAFLQRPWTLLSSMFLHSGLFHLLANMITLYFFGSYLARLIGDRQLLAIYFGGGIVGGILFLLLGPSGGIAIGASGAVFALGGTLTLLRPDLKVFIIPIPVPLPLWVAVVGGFFVLSLFPFVAWQAHLGGLATGLIAGYWLKSRQRRFF